MSTFLATDAKAIDALGVRRSFLLQILPWIFGLYLIATWSSMAGMEILGWTSFALAVAIARPQRFLRGDEALWRWADVVPWVMLWLLWIETALGVSVNAFREADPVFILGSQRWILLLFAFTFLFSIALPRPRALILMLSFMSLIAIYAIIQSRTGIDLLRKDNRAVQPLPYHAGEIWRSAGLFGSPMAYMYIVGQHIMIPFSAALLYPKGRKDSVRLRLIFSGVFLLVAASLVTTYVRGGWIAFIIATLTMLALLQRRLAAIGAFAVATMGTVCFLFLPGFRARIWSLFDSGFSSNSDRALLWAANWKMFKDYPVLGVGYSFNEDRAGEYLTVMGFPQAFTGHAHSTYLQWLSGAGFLGLALFLGVAGFFLWQSISLWKVVSKLDRENHWWIQSLTLATIAAQILIHIGGFTECNFKAGATNHNLIVFWALSSALTWRVRRGILK